MHLYDFVSIGYLSIDQNGQILDVNLTSTMKLKVQTASYNIRRKSRTPLLDKRFDNIDKNISKCAQFINNLLFYSHIKIPNYKNISIYEILDECIGITNERLKTKKVFIYKNLKLLEDLCIEADPLQIRELFINILI